MKTAISLPDQTFENVTRRASELGISRSEFFVVAAERYLEQLDDAALIEQINAAVDYADDVSADVVAAGRRSLAADGDDW